MSEFLEQFEKPAAQSGEGTVLPASLNPQLQEAVLAALSEIFDPEIPVNIVELGLIYRLDCNKDGKVWVDMTLTAPNCPVAESLPNEVKEKAMTVEGVSEVVIELVWTPPWTMENMSEAAKLQLGMFG